VAPLVVRSTPQPSTTAVAAVRVPAPVHGTRRHLARKAALTAGAVRPHVSPVAVVPAVEPPAPKPAVAPPVGVEVTTETTQLPSSTTPTTPAAETPPPNTTGTASTTPTTPPPVESTSTTTSPTEEPAPVSTPVSPAPTGEGDHGTLEGAGGEAGSPEDGGTPAGP
jgi:hypothetical protein